jgi:hypothetical protein
MKKIIFLNALILIFALGINVEAMFGQCTNADAVVGAGNGHTNTGSEYLGFSNSFGPLNFQNFGTTFIQLTTAGLVGIGTASSIPPVWQLEVDQAINVNIPAINAATGYYMIDRNTVLHNGGTANIFTGVRPREL